MDAAAELGPGCPRRRGAGPRWWRRRMVRTDVADTPTAGLRRLPTMRTYPQRQCREDHPVGWGVAGSSHLPAQYHQSVAKDRDLDVFGVRRRAQADQAEDLSEDHESQGCAPPWPHLGGPMSCLAQP